MQQIFLVTLFFYISLSLDLKAGGSCSIVKENYAERIHDYFFCRAEHPVVQNKEKIDWYILEKYLRERQFNKIKKAISIQTVAGKAEPTPGGTISYPKIIAPMQASQVLSFTKIPVL